MAEVIVGLLIAAVIFVVTGRMLIRALRRREQLPAPRRESEGPTHESAERQAEPAQPLAVVEPLAVQPEAEPLPTLGAQRRAAEELERQRIAAEEQARLEEQRRRADEQARREAERMAEEAQRRALEQAEREAEQERQRRAAEQAEIERQATAEAQRLAAQEAERRAAEELERQCAAAAEEQARREHQRRRAEERARLEAERLAEEAAARAETARVEARQREAERLEAARREAERRDAERREAERLEAERLEAERRAAERAAVAVAPRLAPEQTLVMVADDSKVVRVKTSRLLAQRGYRVVLADNGEDAVAKLDGDLPHVLITDVEMPGIDGFELTRTVRASARTAHLPVIMITAADDLAQAAADAGVSLLLGKPFDDDALIAGIERLKQPSPSAAPVGG